MGLKAERTADDKTRIEGEVEVVGLTATSTHEVGAGVTSFRCPHCDDDHPLVVLADRDLGTGEEGAITVRWPEEAVAIAKLLLVEAFDVVSPQVWLAMEAMQGMENERTREKPEVMH